jgi:hypothetical protein
MVNSQAFIDEQQGLRKKMNPALLYQWQIITKDSTVELHKWTYSSHRALPTDPCCRNQTILSSLLLPLNTPRIFNTSKNVYFIIPERVRCQTRALGWSFPKKCHSDFLPMVSSNCFSGRWCVRFGTQFFCCTFVCSLSSIQYFNVGL